MNVLILDYLPQVFIGIATLYFAFQMVRWAERGKYRWIVYALFACLGVFVATVAYIQVEALQAYDTTQGLFVDCTTDWECEQLEQQAEDNE